MTRIPGLLIAATLFWTALAAPLSAQQPIRSLTLSGGLAGSIDEGDTGFSNPVVQLRFAVETSERGNLGVRLGRMEFDEVVRGRVEDVTVDYLSVVGEYMFDEPSHQSGLYIGLGFFDMDGTRLDGRGTVDEGSMGLVIGALGEFKVADRWFIYGEGMASYTGLDVAQIFANLQVGVGYRF